MARPQDVRIRFIGQDETARAFRPVQRRTSNLERSIVRANERLNRFASAFRRLGQVTIAGLAVSRVVDFAQALANADDRVETLRLRLQNVGAGIGINELAVSANRVGLNLEDAANAFLRFSIAGQNIGLTSAEVIRLQENFSALAQAGGATSAELQSGIIQFTQALARGRPDAVELRSILSSIPLVAQAIAVQLGINVSQLQEANTQGRINSQVLADSLLNAKGIAEQLALVRNTLGPTRQRLETAKSLFADALNLSGLWASVINDVTGGINRLRFAIDGTDNTVEELTARLQFARDALQRTDPGSAAFEQLSISVNNLEAQLESLLPKQDAVIQKQQEMRAVNELVSDSLRLQALDFAESKSQLDLLATSFNRTQQAQEQADNRLRGLQLGQRILRRLLDEQRPTEGRQIDARFGFRRTEANPQLQALNKLVRKEEEKQMIDELRKILVTLQENSFKAVAS